MTTDIASGPLASAGFASSSSTLSAPARSSKDVMRARSCRAERRSAHTGQRRWPLLPGARNKKGWKVARGGARGAAHRLYKSATIKQASREVCQNATLIRFPVCSQHSSKPLKIRGNRTLWAQSTSKKRDAWGKWKSRPSKATMYFLAAPTCTPSASSQHGCIVLYCL